MNDHPAIIFAAAMIFIYGLFSKAADRSPVTAPMVFVTVGILVGPAGFDLFHLEARGGMVHILTEITLILILLILPNGILGKKIEERS